MFVEFGKSKPGVATPTAVTFGRIVLCLASAPSGPARSVFACATLALLTSAALAQDRLTVDEAVKTGLERNPQVVAGQAGVSAAYSTYKSVGAFPPVILSGAHVQGRGTETDTLFNLAETIDLSGQKRYATAGTNALFRATKFAFQEGVLVLEQQIRDAYWTLAAAQAQARIADISLKEAERVHDLTVKQESAGASPRSDVVRSSIDVANAKQTLLAAKGAERSALFTFNNLLARNPSTPAALTVDLAQADALPSVQLPSLPELKALAMQNRPLLKSSEEQTRASNYAVKQAEAARFPDLGIDYQRSVRLPTDAIQFTASIPLLDLGSISQSIKAAKATRKQMEALQAQTGQQVDAEIAQAHSNLDIALQSAADYKQEILDPSITLLGMAQLGYQQGATGILPVIDAQATIRNARVGYINSLLAIYLAEDQILAATGVRATAKSK